MNKRGSQKKLSTSYFLQRGSLGATINSKNQGPPVPIKPGQVDTSKNQNQSYNQQAPAIYKTSTAKLTRKDFNFLDLNSPKSSKDKKQKNTPIERSMNINLLDPGMMKAVAEEDQDEESDSYRKSENLSPKKNYFIRKQSGSQKQIQAPQLQLSSFSKPKEQTKSFSRLVESKKRKSDSIPNIYKTPETKARTMKMKQRFSILGPGQPYQSQKNQNRNQNASSSHKDDDSSSIRDSKLGTRGGTRKNTNKTDCKSKISRMESLKKHYQELYLN